MLLPCNVQDRCCPPKPGLKVMQGDTIVTGADGAVGVTFTDNSLGSTGPNSVFSVDKYLFDPTTHAGQFDGTLKKGTFGGYLREDGQSRSRIHAHRHAFVHHGCSRDGICSAG